MKKINPFYIFYIVITFIFFFVYLLMIKMHTKEPFIKQAFFKVVFTQIIYGFLINILILIISILLIINDNIAKIYKYLIFLPILFNFCYMNIIFYNIFTLFYLTFKTKNSENSSTNLEYSDISRSTSNDSISFKKASFKCLHLLSLFFSLSHSIIYFVLLFNKFDLQFYFYYFYSDKKKSLFILIFIPNFLYFILSFFYLCKSKNKEKISENVRLKNYSIFCFLSSLFSLIFPIGIIIYKFLENIDKFDNIDKILKSIISLVILINLFISCRFRISRYYVQTILMQNGKTILDKFRLAFAILFKNRAIPKPNFVDFNSNYIYHSLANINDFVQDFEKHTLANNNHIDSRNFSISVSDTFSQ